MRVFSQINECQQKKQQQQQQQQNKRQKLYRRMGAPLLGLAKSIFLFWIWS